MDKFIRFSWNVFESVVLAVFRFFFRIIKKDFTDEIRKKLMQFVKFCVVGCMNALVLWAVSLIVIFAMEKAGFGDGLFGMEDFAGNLGFILGFFAKVLNSYYWNGKYVFHAFDNKKFSEHLFSYGKLVLSYSASLVVGLLLNILWEKLGLSNKLWSPCNEVITLPMNFLLDKFFAFRKKSKK